MTGCSTTANPTSFPLFLILLERLAEGGDLKGALVSDRRVGTSAKIAQAIRDAGAINFPGH